MHLRSLSLKGFKSFPDRTRLTFSPGVSVVVGPNGSGKSNITDAVLWALGEQSPLAVRGQSMQDVIFSGGHGQAARSSAEVEVVLDNSEGRGDAEFAELSIVRRLARDGEGEYRLNGARCRLVDIQEVLSDTGLGKEMHSVVGQGRVEQIVLSKPADRRLLIEEAAGLGKHRKRRRRAELKLARTEQNLDRALDVEREARSRLRPLKRQAEAADLHRRLERQRLELHAGLVADRCRARAVELGEAESVAERARAERAEVEAAFGEVEERRRAAEARFAARDAERRAVGTLLNALRSAADRIQLRLEAAGDAERSLRDGLAERRERLAALRAEAADLDEADGSRAAELDQELAEARASLDGRMREALGGLEAEAARLEERRAELERELPALHEALEDADGAVRQAESAVESARRETDEAAAARAETAAELERVEASLAAAAAGEGGPSLAASLKAHPGCELALSAALGERLRAAIVDDVATAAGVLDKVRDRAARVVLRNAPVVKGGTPPPGGGLPLADVVDADPGAEDAAQRLLAGIWLVDDLGAVEPGFDGVAVTKDGRALDGRTGELSRLPPQGAAPELAARTRADELRAELSRRQGAESAQRAQLEDATRELGVRRAAREAAEVALRDMRRSLEEAGEEAHRARWLLEQRSEGPASGPEAVRVAQLEAELAAERRHLEASQRAARERAERLERLGARIAAEGELLPRLERLRAALAAAGSAVRRRLAALEESSAAGEAEGEAIAAELRACSAEEARLQDRLRAAVDNVTEAEVSVAHLRDRDAEAGRELREIGERLGLQLSPAAEPMQEDEHAAVERKIERLESRREELGPVNPLAGREYEEAVAHVEELEAQRQDLEQALSEVRGVIGECDRLIREAFEETYEATARNFEEMVGHLFPGGRGRLRMVSAQGPRPVLGDATAETTAPDGTEPAPRAEPESPDRLGVEIEVMPAGKAMRRLSLLSGGEKSLVAIAFLFAVFLARPCPFYVLDEVEAALDDANIDRFLELLRRYSDRTQFIVVTHQKRTMDAADTLYGVTMGGDGVSKVVSRRLPREDAVQEELGDDGAVADAAA